jgi:hypothetical protein
MLVKKYRFWGHGVKDILIDEVWVEPWDLHFNKLHRRVLSKLVDYT